MNVTLSGKNIFVTGGTGTLGSNFIERALSEGARMFFCFHSDEKCARELEAKGAAGFSCDLEKRDSIDSLKSEVEKKCGKLDVLIHCAATVKDHILQNLSTDDWDSAIATNLSAVYYLTKQFISLLRKSEQPRILVLTSRVGIQGGFGQSNYAAAKSGLIALTKTMAAEFGRRGILVNALNPGFMLSKMNENLPDEFKEANLKQSYLEKYSDPREVADFMVYLLSDKVSTVTGQVFHYDSRRI